MPGTRRGLGSANMGDIEVKIIVRPAHLWADIGDIEVKIIFFDNFSPHFKKIRFFAPYYAKDQSDRVDNDSHDRRGTAGALGTL